eukprot:m.225959 g.225959  ORF g.225959 m.225959 type:complete len:1088 (+) comp13862_c0_seq2:4108-7371(+)
MWMLEANMANFISKDILVCCDGWLDFASLWLKVVENFSVFEFGKVVHAHSLVNLKDLLVQALVDAKTTSVPERPVATSSLQPPSLSGNQYSFDFLDDVVVASFFSFVSRSNRDIQSTFPWIHEESLLESVRNHFGKSVLSFVRQCVQPFVVTHPSQYLSVVMSVYLPILKHALSRQSLSVDDLRQRLPYKTGGPKSFLRKRHWLQYSAGLSPLCADVSDLYTVESSIVPCDGAEMYGASKLDKFDVFNLSGENVEGLYGTVSSREAMAHYSRVEDWSTFASVVKSRLKDNAFTSGATGGVCVFLPCFAGSELLEKFLEVYEGLLACAISYPCLKLFVLFDAMLMSEEEVVRSLQPFVSFVKTLNSEASMVHKSTATSEHILSQLLLIGMHPGKTGCTATAMAAEVLNKDVAVFNVSSEAWCTVTWAMRPLHVTRPVPEPRWTSSVFVVSGGNGGVGRLLVNSLRFSHRVVVLSRSGQSDVFVGSGDGDEGDEGDEVKCGELLHVPGVSQLKCNISESSEVERAFAHLKEMFGDHLHIVYVHAAGILSDGLVASQTMEKMKLVSEVKLDGLSNVLSNCDKGSVVCERVVLVSSISAVVGSPGQLNYSFCNSLMQSICKVHTIPSTTIHFGPWDPEIGGMTSKLSVATMSRIKNHSGMKFISQAQGELILPLLLHASPDELCCVRGRKPSASSSSSFSSLRLSLSSSSISAKAEDEFEPSQGIAMGFVDRVAEHEAHLSEKKTVFAFVGEVVGIEEAEVASNMPLVALGLDSLLAIDLQASFAEIGINISSEELLSSTCTCDTLQPQFDNAMRHSNTRQSAESPNANIPDEMAEKDSDNKQNVSGKGDLHQLKAAMEKLLKEHGHTTGGAEVQLYWNAFVRSVLKASDEIDIEDDADVEVEEEQNGKVSLNQRAMWYLWKTIPSPQAYNISYVGRISDGEVLDLGLFEAAVEYVVSQHECLRVVYDGETGTSSPVALKDAYVVEEVRCSDRLQTEADVLGDVKATLAEPMDISKPPVVRFRVYFLPPKPSSPTSPSSSSSSVTTSTSEGMMRTSYVGVFLHHISADFIALHTLSVHICSLSRATKRRKA